MAEQQPKTPKQIEQAIIQKIVDKRAAIQAVLDAAKAAG
jgi:hypothetical protein